MICVDDKKECCGCTACYNICPVSAIDMVADTEGFLYPNINTKKCIQCSKCDQVCQYCVTKKEKEKKTIAYAAYNKNAKMREKSSSGGIFGLLAQKFLNNGGYVIGAAFDGNWNVYHKIIHSTDELPEIMGSKYVQSKLGSIFQEIKRLLLDDAQVLFAGTGCQVSGLKLYLGREYDNLICIDFICLGVPSPFIWQEYLQTYFADTMIESINFKDKSLGWHRFSVKIEGQKTLCEDGRKNYYMNGFFRGYFTRPSCSNCKNKGIARESDLTLADCWGIEFINPELDDNKGTSSVMIHTEKGKHLWKSIEKDVVFCTINPSDIERYNKGIVENKREIRNRKPFWRAWNLFPTKMVFSIFCGPTPLWYLKQIKRMILKKK